MFCLKAPSVNATPAYPFESILYIVWCYRFWNLEAMKADATAKVSQKESIYCIKMISTTMDFSFLLHD